MTVGASGLDLAALGITGTTPASSSNKSSSNKTTLDQTDFLKLMTTQLRNQDPLNPMDNQAFVAQMAQFSSVAGISEMNNSLKTMASSLDSTRIGTATSLVGKYVLVPGSTAAPDSGGNVFGAVTVPDGTTNITITAKDSNGAVVQMMDLGKPDGASQDFGWTASTAGPFTITATGLVGGKSQNLNTNVYGLVRSVDLPTAAGGAMNLDVAGPGSVDFSKVIKVAG